MVNKLIYPLVAVAMGISCSSQPTPQQSEEIQPRSQLEQKADELPGIAIPLEVVADRDAFFDLLSRTRGTELSRGQEYSDDPEDFLRKEKPHFGENYSDFVSDVVNNLGAMRFERANALLVSAENVAQRMNPNSNFKHDLVQEAYRGAAEYASEGYEGLARGKIGFAINVAKTSNIETKAFGEPVVKSAFKKAYDNAKDGYFSLAEDNIEFGVEIASQHGLQAKEYAMPLVQVAFGRALARLREKYNSLADESIDFGVKLAKTHGIDYKPFAKPLIDAALANAEVEIKAGYPSLAASHLDFAFEKAKSLGLGEMTPRIEAVQQKIK